MRCSLGGVSDSFFRRAGGAALRALRALVGERGFAKARESAEVLREEYRAGREGEAAPSPRPTPYRLIPEEGPRSVRGAPREPPAP